MNKWILSGLSYGFIMRDIRGIINIFLEILAVNISWQESHITQGTDVAWSLSYSYCSPFD